MGAAPQASMLVEVLCVNCLVLKTRGVPQLEEIIESTVLLDANEVPGSADQQLPVKGDRGGENLPLHVIFA